MYDPCGYLNKHNKCDLDDTECTGKVCGAYEPRIDCTWNVEGICTKDGTPYKSLCADVEDGECAVPTNPTTGEDLFS